MDVGVVQMPVDPWPVTIQRAIRLESMGFDHVWLYDHLSWKHYRDGPWHATVPWLAAMAARTDRIRLGTMVASPSLRHPLLLAKEAMSLDHVSAGRFVLGLGAGGTGFDATAYGDRPLTAAQRADRLDEYSRVVDGLLRGDVTDHRGRWYTVEGGRLLPGCVRAPRLPLALAAGGRRTIGLAAELADIWITMGDPTGAPTGVDDFLAVVGGQVARLEEAGATADRDPAEIERMAFVSGSFPQPLRSLGAFEDLAGSLAELGFGAIVIHDHRSDDPALDIGAELIEAIADWRTSGDGGRGLDGGPRATPPTLER
jgi:alkanesulfonate monooxygenase SsuD/methylene tetrahydromethanopterin reductase-like flavin-dependent oxidoreductase (luciferase family)